MYSLSMKIKLLTICLFLFSSISWSGEIDGKSIICSKNTGHVYHSGLTGYRFVNGKVNVDIPREFGMAKLEADSLRTTPNYIYWRGGLRVRLDRKTLVLDGEHSDGKYIFWMQCEAMPNIKTYNKKMKKYLQEYIKEFNRLDKILKKGNKI